MIISYRRLDLSTEHGSTVMDNASLGAGATVAYVDNLAPNRSATPNRAQLAQATYSAF